MRIFSYLYDKVISWSRHRHAPYYLASVSFAESSFFPIPPDVMLISMSLAKPSNSWRYAALTSIASVIGGIFGFILGAFFLKLIYPLLIQMGYQGTYQTVQQWFHLYGFWIVFIAGFSPIPYKIFTIGAGAAHMPFVPFIIASIVSRSLRFYMVAGLIYWKGEQVHEAVPKYADWIGWGSVGLVLTVYLIHSGFL